MARVFAQEDGNLNKRPITTQRSRSYSDIDLTFAKKGSGDVFKKTDAAAVKQSVKNLLMTNHGEKPFDHSFGGDLHRFLFELEDVDTFEVEDIIMNALARYEPRAIFRGVDVNPNPDRNAISVLVKFQVINVPEILEINVNITRLR